MNLAIGWGDLNEKEQACVSASVDLLELFGPGLGFPHSSDIKGSRHGNLRELRVQHGGRPYRVLYAFDPRRCALLLIGGDKTGQDRWYEDHVPMAENCMTNTWKHCVKRAATMAKKFAELQARMSPESRADAEQLLQQHLKEMPLHELRKAQELSQETLAKALHVNQAAISKMERRTDMYISTLRNYIRAMGGELEIIATFPEGQVKIENFAK